jgi:hypothetical protein
MQLTGQNPSSRGKTCPSATLSTTNPTWTDRGSNPGLRDGRPATNRLSHGTARVVPLDAELRRLLKSPTFWRRVVVNELLNDGHEGRTLFRNVDSYLLVDTMWHPRIPKYPATDIIRAITAPDSRTLTTGGRYRLDYTASHATRQIAWHCINYLFYRR